MGLEEDSLQEPDEGAGKGGERARDADTRNRNFCRDLRNFCCCIGNERGAKALASVRGWEPPTQFT